MTLLGRAGQQVVSPTLDKRGRPLPPPPKNIRLIYPNATPLGSNHELVFAALKIQKVWRGGHLRSILWSFYGILTQSRVLKIQRLWRGHRGRILAAKLIYDKQVRAAIRISLMYRCWKARRILRIKRTEYLNKIVTRIQSLFRARAERKLVAAWLLARRIAKATVIQGCFRGHLGRRRARGVRQRLADARMKISTFIRENISSAFMGSKSNVGMLQDLNEWEIFEIGLLSVLGTKKFEQALDIAAYLIRRSPNFEMGFFLRALALLASWTDVGLARFIREDRLEEAVLIFQQSSRWGTRDMFTSTHGIPPYLQGADKYSLFNDFFDEMELTFFKAAYQRTLEDMVPDVTIVHLMALRAMLCSSWGRFGLTIDRGAMHLAESAKRHMAHARSLGIAGETAQYVNDQMDMKAEVVEHLFGKEHVVLYSEVKVFPDCPLYDPPVTYADPDLVEMKEPSRKNTSTKKSLLKSRPGSQQTADGRDIYSRAPPPIPCVKARVRVMRSGGGLLIVTADLLSPGLASAKTLKMVQNTSTGAIKIPTKWQGILQNDDDEQMKERAEEGSPNKLNSAAVASRIDTAGTANVSDIVSKPATAEYPLGAGFSRPVSTASVGDSRMPPTISTTADKDRDDPKPLQPVGVYSDFPVVRPIVVRSEEINRILEMAIDHCAATNRTSALEARRRGKWMNVGQFLLDKIRFVSCSSVALPFDASIELDLFTVRKPPRNLPPPVLPAVSSPLQMNSPFSPLVTRPGTSATESSFPVQLTRAAPASSIAIAPFATNIQNMNPSMKANPDTALSLPELPATRQANWTINSMAAKMSLPQLELMRRERNDLRIEETSVRLLQRAFRGHKGRSLFRRLLFRSNEQARQQERGRVAVEELLTARAYRFGAAAAIQKRMRGYLWRKQLAHMKFCALIVQCAYRIYKAKCDISAERRRKLLGPDVITMHKGEVVIGDRNFYLTVYRCGYNYRLIGQDNVNNQVYDGDVLKPQVVEILAEHNATITGTTVADKQSMIQLWQHQKVTKYIISRLGLAKVITSVTNELGAKKSDTRLALVVLPTAKGRFKGIEERTNLRRFLRDQSSVIERIEKREAAKAAALAHEKKYEKYMSTGGSVSGSVDTASPSRQSTAAAGSRSGLNTAASGARTTSIFAVSPSKSTTTALSRTAGAGGSSGPNTPQVGRGTTSLLSRNTLSFR